MLTFLLLLALYTVMVMKIILLRRYKVVTL